MELVALLDEVNLIPRRRPLTSDFSTEIDNQTFPVGIDLNMRRLRCKSILYFLFKLRALALDYRYDSTHQHGRGAGCRELICT